MKTLPRCARGPAVTSKPSVSVEKRTAKSLRMESQRRFGWVLTVRFCVMSVEIGQEAPDFELRSSTGDTVKLSSVLGEKAVALVFYPFPPAKL